MNLDQPFLSARRIINAIRLWAFLEVRGVHTSLLAQVLYYRRPYHGKDKY